MYLIMLTVAVMTTARSSLDVFFNFIHLFLFKGRIGPERQREMVEKTFLISEHIHIQNCKPEETASSRLSLFAPVCAKQKKHTHTHTQTHSGV